MDILKRQKDIVSLINNLDITPTMHLNATQKYKRLAKYLIDNGIDAEIYPQGSFALGTVVRPITRGDDAKYDLDFVCQVYASKDTLSSSELREKVLGILQDSKTFDERLEICEECFTIEYSDIGGIGFSIDVVPAVPESQETISRLVTKNFRKDLVEAAISIPKQEDKKYSWITSNPRGYKIWFNEINSRFNDASRLEYRQSLFENNKHLFRGVEEVPEELERSALQRVVQILKVHRDVYYSHISQGEELKPISAIINTLVAKIASTVDSQTNVFDLLQYVLDNLLVYAEQLTLDETSFNIRYGGRDLLIKKGDLWVISNPANPEDNLANQWTNVTAKIFFKWIEAAKNDLIYSLQLPDDKFRLRIENAFGKNFVSKRLGEEYLGSAKVEKIDVTTVAKPWKK